MPSMFSIALDLTDSPLLALRPLPGTGALVRALRTDRFDLIATDALLAGVSYTFDEARAVVGGATIFGHPPEDRARVIAVKKRYDDTFRAIKKNTFAAALVAMDGMVLRPDRSIAAPVPRALSFAVNALAAGVEPSLVRLQMNAVLVQNGFGAILLRPEDAERLAVAVSCLFETHDAGPFLGLLADRVPA